MAEDERRAETKPKKPYRKPEVKQVPLRPEEAVLGNCKTTSISGPAAASCTIFACLTNGS